MKCNRCLKLKFTTLFYKRWTHAFSNTWKFDRVCRSCAKLIDNNNMWGI